MNRQIDADILSLYFSGNVSLQKRWPWRAGAGMRSLAEGFLQGQAAASVTSVA